MQYQKKLNYSFLLLLFLSLVITLILVLNGYGAFSSVEVFQNMNATALWYSLLNSHYGANTAFILPMILAFGTTYYFYQQLKSNIYQDMILRKGYKQTMLSMIFRCYKMALFFPLVMLVFYGVCFLIAPRIVTDSNSLGTFLLTNPFGTDGIVVLKNIGVVLLLQYLFAIFVVNISLFSIRYSKKFYLSLLFTFLLLNICNYVMVDVGVSLLHVRGEYLFELMMTNEIANAKLTFLLTLPLSFILCFLAYVKKERVVISHAQTVRSNASKS